MSRPRRFSQKKRRSLARKRYTSLYMHMRLVHDVTPIELDLAQTLKQLDTMHAKVAPGCPRR